MTKRSYLLPIALVFAIGAAHAQSPKDRAALIELSNRLDETVDAKAWPEARALFVDTIAFAFGENTVDAMPADDLVGMWEEYLYEGKSSFHLRGGHVVTFSGRNDATVTSKGYAWNRVEGLDGGDLWEVWGDYVYKMERVEGTWKITSFNFQPLHERGNPDVPMYLPE